MRNLTKWLGTVLGALLLGGLIALPRLERTYAPDAANITDMGDTLWYGLVTLTTVGYGDYFPVSMPGKIVGALFVLSSLGVLGVLIGKVADAFTAYREHRRLGHHGLDVTDHIVIFGWSDSTRRIVNQIHSLNRRIVVVTQRRESVDDIHERFSDLVFPLYAEFDDAALLEKINLRQADRALLNVDSDTDTLIYLLNLRKNFPDVDFDVALYNEELRDTFRNAGVANVISAETNAAHLMASIIFEPDVARFAQELITTAREEEEYDMNQYRVPAESPAVDMQFGALFRSLYEDHRVVAIGVSKPVDGDRHIHKLPDDDEPVSVGDGLILIGPQGRMNSLVKTWNLA